MFHNRSRKRQGMTSLIEAVICLALVSLVLLCLIRLSNITNTRSVSAEAEMVNSKQIDTFVDVIKTDIKGAVSVSMMDNDLKVSRPLDFIIYHFDDENKAILRDSEVVIENINTCVFQTVDDNYAKVYAITEDDDIISFQVYR